MHKRRLHRGSGKFAPVLVKEPRQTTHFAPILIGTWCQIDTIILLHFLHLSYLQNVVTINVFPGLHYEPNSLAAGSPPRTPLGSLRLPPELIVKWEGDTAPHYPIITKTLYKIIYVKPVRVQQPKRELTSKATIATIQQIVKHLSNSPYSRLIN